MKLHTVTIQVVIERYVHYHIHQNTQAYLRTKIKINLALEIKQVFSDFQQNSDRNRI